MRLLVHWDRLHTGLEELYFSTLRYTCYLEVYHGNLDFDDIRTVLWTKLTWTERRFSQIL